MNMRVPDDLTTYEQRIASLEAKLRSLESQMVARSAPAGRFDLKIVRRGIRPDRRLDRARSSASA